MVLEQTISNLFKAWLHFSYYSCLCLLINIMKTVIRTISVRIESLSTFGGSYFKIVLKRKLRLRFRLVKKLFFARLFWHIETISLRDVSFSATQQFLFLPKNCYYQLKNTIFTRIFRPFLLRKRSYIIVDWIFL